MDPSTPRYIKNAIMHQTPCEIYQNFPETYKTVLYDKCKTRFRSQISLRNLNDAINNTDFKTLCQLYVDETIST